MYDPDTGILRYTIYKWSGSLETREYHVASISDNFIVLDDEYGIIPLNYYGEMTSSDADLDVPDPESHRRSILTRVPTEKEQEYYSKYKISNFTIE